MSWLKRIQNKVGGWMGRERMRDRLAAYDPSQNYQASTFFAPEVVVNQLPPYHLRTGMLMVDTDPVVEFAMSVRNAALMVADVEIIAKDERVKAWVEKQWRTAWDYHRSKLVQAKKWGFYGLQVLWRHDAEGFIHIDGFKDFAPWDVKPLQAEGEISGFEVRGMRLDAPQALWQSFDAKWGNPYGSSLLRRMYPPWYEKWMDRGAKKLGQLRMMKDAYIGDIFWYPPNLALTLTNGQKIPWRDFMRQMAEQRISGGALTIPMMTDDKGNKQVDYTPPQDIAGGSQIFEWEERLDKNILRGAGVPLETVEAQENGGFSGRSIPFMVILSSCSLELTEIVESLTRMCLRPAAWMNFGGDPEFEIKPKSLVESFAQDASGSPMGGGAIGGQPGQKPPPQEPTQIQRESEQFDMEADTIQFGERLRAPKGGTTIKGKFYAGGKFIPGEVVAKMSDKEKAAVKEGKSPDKKPAVKATLATSDHADPFTRRANAQAAIKGKKAHEVSWEAHADAQGKFSPEERKAIQSLHRDTLIRAARAGKSIPDAAYEGHPDLQKMIADDSAPPVVSPKQPVKPKRDWGDEQDAKEDAADIAEAKRLRLPADKPVPPKIKSAVETHAAKAMRLAHAVMKSPHADYTDFRQALRDAWAHIKGELTILYRDEDFAEPEKPAEHAPSKRERQPIEAQQVMARLARMKGAKALQMSADAAGLTLEEVEILRLFAALEMEDDETDREEITREIVAAMGAMFEEPEAAQFDLPTDTHDDEITSAGARAAFERVKNSVAIMARDIKSKALPTGGIENALRMLAENVGIDLAASMQTAAMTGAANVVAAVPPALNAPPKASAPPVVPPTYPPVSSAAGDAPEPIFPVLSEVSNRISAAPIDAGRTFRETAEKARAGAFAVTGDLSEATIQALRDRLVEVFDKGGNEDDFANVVISLTEEGPLSEARLRQIFRTNVSVSTSDGQRHAVSTALVSDAFPYRRYFATTDARVRHEHMALETAGLNGTAVYRGDDPVWREFEPPWDFGCRCDWTPYTVEMAANEGVQEAQDWLKRAKEAAGPDGDFHDHLAATAPDHPQHVTHPPFHAPAEFRRDA